jgi:hypothetical protein
MAERIFLHVGPRKTGSTYVQSVVWANKATLREQGLLLPLGRVRDHFLLTNVVREGKESAEPMPPRGRALWGRMLAQVEDWPGDVLLSHELFSAASDERALWALEQLGQVGSEVHVIVAARDLARQIPAKWQQSVKQGLTMRLREYCECVRTMDPAADFWATQHIPDQLRRWGRGTVDDKHVHLVTLPPAGADPAVLWARFASVIAVMPDSVDLSMSHPNESLGAVEVELLRRVNEIAPMGQHKPLRQNMVRIVLANGILAQRDSAQRFGVPPEAHDWVVRRGRELVDELREMSFDLVGDLDDLLPAEDPVRGPVPDDVTDEQIAPAAIQTISAVLYDRFEHETSSLRAEISRLKAELAGADRDSRKRR